MANAKVPGILGGLTNIPIVNSGTTCVQSSPLPGTIGGATISLANRFLLGPILVGKSARNPGFNTDGTPAEDMMYGDNPPQAASLKSDPVFKCTDATLNVFLRELMESLSMLSMETVAVEMQKQFSSGVGGTYSSPLLNDKIKNNSTFITYHNKFSSSLKASLHTLRYDPDNLAVRRMRLLNFSSFGDKVTGLGITVHQVWSVKAELKNFRLDCHSSLWKADLVYTFYDHYGLDWADIQKHGGDMIPQPLTGYYFKAWYILQHFRSAKPLLTVMKITKPISGSVQ